MWTVPQRLRVAFGVQVRERRILLAGLVVGQRVIHDRVLRDFRQRDVVAHVVQVRAIVLAHDEKLSAVAEHGRADAALLEPRTWQWGRTWHWGRH